MTFYKVVNDDGNREKIKRFMIISLLLIAVLCYGVYWAFFDLNRLPTGEFLTEETSPDGKYTLRAYVTNGGTTTSFAVRGELVLHEENEKIKNVYWNYKEDTAKIAWLDKDTVVINGHT
ncbi:DUF5412 family protein [Metabacillus niabensis]|uniref:DUF5412 family protein n=1 Tax=Metabacillus niabensis TaxID=324854 RepID=UPI0039A35EF8